MPTAVESNYAAWLTFLASPVAALRQRSFVFAQDGVSAEGGPATVSGCEHVDIVSVNGALNATMRTEYEIGTRVSALKVKPGGNGSVYWYPYIMAGVGECNIPYDVPDGVVALTAGMNGCSLRIYANPDLGVVKYCHDNNGQYAIDATYAARGFQHVLSVNAGDRERGTTAQNINNYWADEYYSPGTGVYFIAQKTAPLQWTIYRSVALGNYRNSVTKKLFGPDKIEMIYTFRGSQRDNGQVTIANLPVAARAAPTVARTMEDLPASAAAGRGRRGSF
jgi:hypothetical protein